MKRTPKWAFFIVAILILVFGYTAVFGVYTTYGDRTDTVIRSVSEIRWGIDIRGGVDVTFGPKDEAVPVDAADLEGVKSIIEQRLVSRNITDYEAYTDAAEQRVIVRFPFASTTETPEEAVKEIGKTAMLEFHYGNETDSEGKPTGKLVLTGNDVESASPDYVPTDEAGTKYEYVVELKLKESGKKAFSDATAELAGKGKISIWLDGEMRSDPDVREHISNGIATISGGFETYEDAKYLADVITAGSLPFEIEAKSLGSISPTMGTGALKAMAIAAVIALIAVCLMMIVTYRLPGLVAAIALLGQMAASVAAITGYFGVFDSFTLTLPGIAGLILSIGIGVDCNVITAEAVREELRAGKTIDGAIRSGSKNSFWAIFDGNITVLIVAVVLMGVFGASDSLFGLLFSWLPMSTTGTVYSFGYTLMVGVVTNFIFGIWASRLMLRSVSRLKLFRKPWFYGGDRA
ncbi:MAG: protein translocase subunit SecD [Ruminococcaceae bacterium]|nr:protein translocase subunit SecD [Oscillospiraceae bacterium]